MFILNEPCVFFLFLRQNYLCWLSALKGEIECASVYWSTYIALFLALILILKKKKKTTLQVAFESDLLFGGKTYSGK